MNILLAVEVAQSLIRRFEGCYLSPYLCPAGIPTIGYGATYYEDGTRVALTDQSISKERAEALLVWMVHTVYLPAVLKLCPSLDTPDRLAAIIDFTFNLGSKNLSHSTLRRKLNKKDWEASKKELMKWTLAKGHRLKGLMVRREAESNLL